MVKITSVSSSQPRALIFAITRADGFVDQLVHHMNLGVDLADVVGRQLLRREVHRPAFDVGERAVVIGEPVRGLLRQHFADLFRRAGIAVGQRQIAPVAALNLRLPADPRDDADREN